MECSIAFKHLSKAITGKPLPGPMARTRMGLQNRESDKSPGLCDRGRRIATTPEIGEKMLSRIRRLSYSVTQLLCGR